MLPAKFRAALDVIVPELEATPGVLAVLFFGSAARGKVSPTSDIDLYAITERDTQRHLGRRESGVMLEVSFASIAQMRERLERETPIIVHAFATGRLLFDRSGGAATLLCSEGAALWKQGPRRLTSSDVVRWRFHLTDRLYDLEGVPASTPGAILLAAESVQTAIAAYCAAHQLWLPSARRAVDALSDHDAAFADLVRECAERGFPRQDAIDIVESVLSVLGGRLESYDTSAE